MAALRVLALSSVALIVACDDPASFFGSVSVAQTSYTYCCDPSDRPPEGGYYVGRVRVTNTEALAIWVRPISSVSDGIEVVLPGVGAVRESVRLEAGGFVEFDLYSHVCSVFDQTVTFAAFDAPGAPDADSTTRIEVTVSMECPPSPEPFPYLILPSCGVAERADAVTESGFFAPGTEQIVGGTAGAVCCAEDGAVLQRIIVPAVNGVTALFRSARGTPQLAQASFASEAILAYGPSMIAISAWIPANNAFGMIALAGGQDNWTDVVSAGDPQATDLYMAVGFTGRRIARIAPGQLTGQWTFGGTEIVQPAVFDPAWGGPVTACRLERTGDIVTAHEPSLTDPGNLVVVSMGGDDVGDSAAVVGQTGLQPRVLRGLDGVFAVTCFGEDTLSIFRKTATGYEKLGDEVVGDGPLGLSVKRLADGKVAFLSTGSRDDTWSVTTVDPATGAVTTTTNPVPVEIDEPTDCDWGEGDDAYILGKASANIARIDSGVE